MNNQDPRYKYINLNEIEHYSYNNYKIIEVLPANSEKMYSRALLEKEDDLFNFEDFIEFVDELEEFHIRNFQESLRQGYPPSTMDSIRLFAKNVKDKLKE